MTLAQHGGRLLARCNRRMIKLPVGLALLAVVVLVVGYNRGVRPTTQASDSSLDGRNPRVRLRAKSAAAPAAGVVPPKSKVDSLKQALNRAREALARLDDIRDYTYTFLKREWVGGELSAEQKLSMKIRHEPFSVYTRFLSPDSQAGQEALYVEGRNDNKLLGHPTGLQHTIVGTVALDPKGFFAMLGSRYPITDAGMKNLLLKLIQLGETKGLLDDATVEFRKGDEDAMVDGRPTTLLEIRCPAAKPNFKLAVARVFIDDAWNLPVKFEAYEWPDEPGRDPTLVEQYTYLDLKLNPGLTDLDFDVSNPEYEFD